ncbi:MAG: MATE family efflux transporter [Clostridiales bacterium]|nr:MATE family efflux transporter [Clostridiales bacterium]
MAKSESNQSANLGEGNVGRLLLRLAIPSVVAQLINMLYNIVDRIYIGHMPEDGSLALTGLGLCFAVIILISAFASLVGAGGAPRAAIYMGKQDNKTAEKILGNCFTALILIAVVLTVVFQVIAEPMLRLFGASDSTLPYALSYMRIYVMGTLFVMTVLGMNVFITAQGFANFSMLTTVIGAVCNIILDPILIFGLNMGVRGAATATILSQGVSAVWVLRFLLGKKTVLKLKKEHLPIRGDVLLPCMALGVSPFVMQSTEAILNVCFNSSLAKYGGDVAVGSFTIISSCMQCLSLPLMGMCQGAQPLMSFNFGARKNDRVRQTFRYLLVICVAFSCLFCVVAELAPTVMAGIFSSDAEMISYTAWAMRIYMAGAFSMGVQMCCQQSFMALSQARISLLLACLRKIILLIPLIYILPNFFGNKVFGVLLAEPVSDILAAVVTAIMFFTHLNGILEQGPGK